MHAVVGKTTDPAVKYNFVATGVSRRGHRAIAVALSLVWALGICPGTSVPVLSAPLDTWEVMRVYVEDDLELIQRLASDNYSPVRMDRLATLLAEEQERRRGLSLESTGVAVSTYVASLTGDRIVSESSRWVLAGGSQRASVDMGELSIALGRCRGAPSEHRQLIDYCSFSTDGSLYLPFQPSSPTYWFGFSAKGQTDNRGQNFRFTLPAAPLSKFFLSAPTDKFVFSDDVVVQPVSTPRDYLPDDWEIAPPNQPLGGDTQWWLVHCSGKSSFELTIRDDVLEESAWFKHAILSARCDYQIGGERVDVSGRFNIAAGLAGVPIRVHFDKRMKFRDVSLDGNSVDWSLLSSTDGDGLLLELAETTTLGMAHTLLVQAVMVGKTANELELPNVSVAEAYCIDGRTTVSAVDSRLIHQVDSGGHRVDLQTPSGLVAAVVPAQTWNVRWLGTPPPVSCKIARKRQPWQVRSLTKLSMQADWITGGSRIRIKAEGPRKNEVRLQIGKGWFVDSVQVKQSSEPELQAAYFGANDSGTAEILVTWSGSPAKVAFDLDVAAHRPQRKRGDRVNVGAAGLVDLPGAQQLDNFAIEATGQYRAIVNANLLRFQLQPRELPQWQQDLLATESKQWLFRGVQGRIPPITLQQRQGSFAANLVTSARSTKAGSEVTCVIEVIPQSGSIDTIALRLPDSGLAEDWQWSLHTDGATTGKVLAFNRADSSMPSNADPSDDNGPATTDTVASDDPSQSVELQLPQPFSVPFTLIGRCVPDSAPVDLAGSSDSIDDQNNAGGLRTLSQFHMDVPIASVINAVDVRSHLILPKGVSILPPERTLTLLAPGAMVESEATRLLRQRDPTLDVDESVIARLDPNARTRLSVAFSSEPPAWQPWVANEQIIHTVQTSGRRMHRMVWSVESAGTTPLEVTLPAGWSVQQLSLDSEETRNYQSRGVRLSIPIVGKRRAAVELICISSGRAAHGWTSTWWPVEGLERPQLKAAVLQRAEFVRVPPEYLSIASLNPLEDTNRLLDRLMPSNLWRWLSPEVPLISSARSDNASSTSPILTAPSNVLGDAFNSATDPASTGWTSVELTESRNQQTGQVWLINRTGMAAFSLAAILLIFGLLRWAAGYTASVWFAALLIASVLVVLAPAPYLPVVQLMLLGVACACFLRFALPMLLYRKGPAVVRGGGTRASSRYVGRGSAGVGAMLLIVVPVGPIVAQVDEISTERRRPGMPQASADSSPSTSAEARTVNPVARPSGSRSGLAKAPSTIYPLLIPVDGEGQAGSYVYAPIQLQQLLENPGDETAQGQPPQIYSADYRIRIRRNASTGEFLAQELVVDMTVRFADLNTELELPFDTTVNLTGGQVNGQELSVGGRLYQNYGTNLIVYQPISTGVQQLQLRFDDLIPKRENGRFRLRFSVPPIATASLRIAADSQQDFEVEAIGQVQRSMSGVLAKLGPVREVDIAWPAENERTAPAGSAPLRPSADTWVHVSGSEVLAACQLSFAGGLNAQRDLSVLCDVAWEPVGAAWGDFELVDKAVVALGSQVSYVLRKRESNESRPDSVVRVLMAPRELREVTSLKVPFLTMQGTTQPSRLVAWTAEGVPNWRPEDLGFWRELPESANIAWGPLRLSATPPRYYQLPIGSFSTSLRRTPESPLALVDESTEVHLGFEGERVRYTADYGQAPETNEPIRVVIPSDSVIEKVLLDGSPADYSIGDTDGFAILLIGRATGSRLVRKLEIDLWRQREGGEFHPLPRVAVVNATCESSIYRVLRGTGLTCELVSENAEEIAWTTADARPSELLAGLEAAVGQTELGDKFRNDAALPVLYRLQRKAMSTPTQTILYLDRENDSWKARFTTVWQTGDEPIDIACIDIPAMVRDAIDVGSVARRIIPTGDASRQILCLIPPDPVDGRVAMELSLPLFSTAAGQAIALPDLSIVGGDESSRSIAVPRFIEGRRVVWSGVGAARSDAWLTDVSPENREQYDFYDFPETAKQLSWRTEQAGVDRTASIVQEHLVLNAVSDGRLAGVLEYWVDPAQQLKMEFAVPENCRIVGVQNGIQPAKWHRSGADRISVLLQPNYLPVCIRLLLQWDLAAKLDSKRSWEIEIPRVIAASDRTLVAPGLRSQVSRKRTLQNHMAWLVPVVSSALGGTGNAQRLGSEGEQNGVSNMDEAVNASRGAVDRASTWHRLLSSFVATAGTLGVEERRRWLQSWSPASQGLASALPIATLELEEDFIAANDSLTEEPKTVEAYWNEVCAELGVEKESLGVSEQGHFASALVASIGPEQYGMEAGWFEPFDASDYRLTLVAKNKNLALLPRLVAAGLLLLASVLMFVLSRRIAQRYWTYMATNAWAYWLQLAVLAGIILPVAWPSLILLLTASLLGTSQYLENRRRRRTLAQV